MIEKTYNEESIVTLNYREAVRSSIGMYIGSSDSKGMHHLFQEILSNSIDEAAAGYGNTITVGINTKINMMEIADIGRGIPFRQNSSGKWALVEMCTNLHSGGKFENAGNYKSALGLHGVGSTVVNALSTYFKIQSFRKDGNAVLEFQNGEQKEFKITDKLNKETGSVVSFIPDDTVFTKAIWDINAIKETMQLNAILNNELRFILNVDGKEVANFFYIDGLKEFLKIKMGESKPITTLNYFKTVVNEGTATETEVEIVFQYVNDGKERTYAFTNGGYNPDLGTHVTGFRSAFTSLLNIKGREYGLFENEEKNLDGALLRKGLFVAISLRMVERPQFSSQTKEKLTSASARASTSQAVGAMPVLRTDIEAIIKKALIEKKSEEAAQRKRDAEKRISVGGKNINPLKDLPEKFADCINKRGQKELFIVEGRSAAGTAKLGRDLNTQAIYPLRGKPLNTWMKELPDIIKNAEIKDLLLILGCGVGEGFNIKNLRYNKIIALNDADTDGGHIACLLFAFFMFHLPDLIKNGNFYFATPPIYRVVKGKESKYLFNANDLKLYRNWEATRYKGLGEMSAQELWESTMDPETRQLIQATPDRFPETYDLVNVIMGSKPGSKKEFILKNAKEFMNNVGNESDYDVESD